MPRQTTVHPKQARPEDNSRAAMDELAAADTRTSEHVTVEDVDAILDEIDSVLEENAEEFIRHYVQKGGQAAAVLLDRIARGFGVPRWRFT